MTRSQRYAEINGLLYGMFRRGETLQQRSMLADEVDRFELFCPEFDSLSDDRTTKVGPNRINALRRFLGLHERP